MPADEKPESPVTSTDRAFVLLPKSDRVVLVRVPALEELIGIAKGANSEGYRDRKDRY